MKRICVFRVEVAGCLYRVMESRSNEVGGMFDYWVEHNRRVLAKGRAFDARGFIRIACEMAFGSPVTIAWGAKL